ncbi:hypothetical protein DYH09_06080 [bacterium CPR1]|nr:hypothetical protein [bacterium CPR1]
MGFILGLVEWTEAFLKGRDRTYLIGAGVVGLLLFWVFFSLVKSLWGLIIVVTISAGLGYAAERFYPAKHNHGLIGMTLFGLVGALIGQRLLGTLGPSIAGVRIIPAFAGILLVNWLVRSMRLASRARTLEKYNARVAEDSMILSKLDEYRIVERLGSGAYSRVYRAVSDRTLNEDESIAVKIFNEEAIKDEEFTRRLEREIELLQRLDHPGIVKVFKSGHQGDLHFMTMEYADGETLSSRLRKDWPNLGESVDMTIAIGGVLGYAHKLGVVHRDIKPDNIILSKSGPRILDFGLARPEGRSSLTQAGTALGTPAYMSPEQIRDDEHVDGRADQYALGCVLFELITGRRPFEGDQSVQIMMKHLNEPLQDPRKLNPAIPDQLAKCVWYMMAKDKNNRFPNMEAALAQLKQVQAELKAQPAGKK